MQGKALCIKLYQMISAPGNQCFFKKSCQFLLGLRTWHHLQNDHSHQQNSFETTGPLLINTARAVKTLANIPMSLDIVINSPVTAPPSVLLIFTLGFWLLKSIYCLMGCTNLESEGLHRKPTKGSKEVRRFWQKLYIFQNQVVHLHGLKIDLSEGLRKHY